MPLPTNHSPASDAAPCSASSISDPPEYSALWYADRIVSLEAKLKDRNKHIRKLADASSVLWDEHKEYSEELFGVKGCDVHGRDSEGHEMMQDIVNETLDAVNSPQNVRCAPTGAIERLLK